MLEVSTHGDAEEALRTLLTIQDSQDESREWTLISAVAVAESFVDRLVERLVASSEVARSAFGRKLLRENSNSFSQSWTQRNMWLDEGFDIHMSGTRTGQDLMVIVEVRNALMHGLGNLTDRQVKSSSSAIALQGQIRKLLRSQVHGRKVVLGREAGTRATAIARQYVTELDRISQVHY
jgi:hypothetical protein